MKRILLILAALLIPTYAHAQATFVQVVAAAGGTGTTHSSSVSATYASGHLLIANVVIGGGTTNPALSVADSGGVNGWTRITGARASNASLFGGCVGDLFYSFNVTGFTGTVTSTSGLNISGFSSVIVIDYSNAGGWVSDPIDGSGATGTGNGTPTAGAMTLAQASELVYGYVVNATGTPAWVNLTDRLTPLTSSRLGDYQGAGSGSYTVAMASGGGQYIISAVAFKVPLVGYVTQVGAFLVGP